MLCQWMIHSVHLFGSCIKVIYIRLTYFTHSIDLNIRIKQLKPAWQSFSDEFNLDLKNTLSTKWSFAVTLTQIVIFPHSSSLLISVWQRKSNSVEVHGHWVFYFKPQPLEQGFDATSLYSQLFKTVLLVVDLHMILALTFTLLHRSLLKPFAVLYLHFSCKTIRLFACV